MINSHDIEDMSPDEPEKAAWPVECRCTMTQKLVGDGCEVCNPEAQS